MKLVWAQVPVRIDTLTSTVSAFENIGLVITDKFDFAGFALTVCLFEFISRIEQLAFASIKIQIGPFSRKLVAESLYENISD